MPANTILINLIGQEDLSRTPQGRIVQWAMTYGRYIMILTEVVVLAAFISRFTLDRKLTDLKEEITQKQAIIEANADLEQNIRTAQIQLEQTKNLLTNQDLPQTTLGIIESILPTNVFLESLDIKPDTVSTRITAKTTEGFAQVLANLKALKQWTNVSVGSIQKTPLLGIQFDVKATIAKPKEPAKDTPDQPEPPKEE